MKYFCLLAFMLGLFIPASAQNVTITPAGITPVQNGSYPRLSYDAILAIASPQIGDMAFDLTYNCLRVYMDGKWLCSYQDPSNYVPNLLAIVSAGGTNGDYGNDVVVDNSGNVYVTGYFSGSATFGTTTKTSAGVNDIFVAKYNPAGTLQWVQTAGGSGEDLGFGLALDGSGNVYVTGYFSGSATFGAYSKTSAGVADIFVAKYDPNGTVQWVQSAGGTSGDFGNDIAVDGSGNVYVIGYFFGTATFGATTENSEGFYDLFVVKYNTTGTLQWVQTPGGAGNDYGYGIEVDGTGNVYVTGSFQQTATFGITTKTSSGLSDIFLAKYNSSGVVQWVQTAGGTTNDQGRRLVIDGSNNVYVTGSFSGIAAFGTISKTPAGVADIFLAKYNSGGIVQWVQTAGGLNEDLGLGLALDGSGNVYITGSFSETATFSTNSKTSLGSTDIFVSKYNSSGTFQWVQTAGGANADEAKSIVVDTSGNVYMTGYFRDTATFGRNSKTSAGSYDLFIGRLEK